MKIAEIDWPLFWQAWRQQNPLDRELWLARWLFADDAVKLSRHPAAPGKIRDNTAQGGGDPVSAKFAAAPISRKTDGERSNSAGTDRGWKSRRGAPTMSGLYPVD